MRIAWIGLVLLVVGIGTAVAGDAPVRVWRCGNIYTNSAAEAAARGCTPLESAKPSQNSPEYEACIRQAAAASTNYGVMVGMDSCRRQFGPRQSSTP